MTRAIHGPMSEAQRRGMQLEAARLSTIAALYWLERECGEDSDAAVLAATARRAANAAFNTAIDVLEVSE